MNCYFDTSALIKKYVNEEGSEEVVALLEKSNKVIVSPATFIECASVLKRLRAAGAITASQTHNILEEIERDAAYFDHIPFDSRLENASVRVVLDHNLRTLDAIQLASALLRKSEIDRFVSCDKKLLDAAKKEKFRVEDPTDN